MSSPAPNLDRLESHQRIDCEAEVIGFASTKWFDGVRPYGISLVFVRGNELLHTSSKRGALIGQKLVSVVIEEKFPKRTLLYAKTPFVNNAMVETTKTNKVVKICSSAISPVSDVVSVRKTFAPAPGKAASLVSLAKNAP